MKNLLLFALLLGFTFNLNAQDTEPDDDFKKWQVRLRLINIIPNESADIETINGDVDISTAIVPELDFTYFFTKHWAAELILGTANHDVDAVNTDVDNIDLGDVWLLPPTLTLQYHFYSGDLKPYLGAGINYTIFYGVDEGPTADNIEYDNSFGFAFQSGFDYMLNDKWFVNLDAKYIFINTEATIDATSELGAIVRADVDINPFVIGLGIGMKF
ncbi:OmpW family outer membrane protein [Winogradskyella sp.]|uniref:OmpW/AlkL family protein n=1 Tax=Winogradskyella sp. TaxID=1883156 RepID=UPI00260EA735|nr:OmpW family outer membrane protein [Winogradskyella sp.]